MLIKKFEIFYTGYIRKACWNAEIYILLFQYASRNLVTFLDHINYVS